MYVCTSVCAYVPEQACGCRAAESLLIRAMTSDGELRLFRVRTNPKRGDFQEPIRNRQRLCNICFDELAVAAAGWFLRKNDIVSDSIVDWRAEKFIYFPD